MISYLINFTLCSGLLLAVYYLLLQNKSMYIFNRFYLLCSIVFSLVVPSIVIEQAAPIVPINPVQEYVELQLPVIVVQPSVIESPLKANGNASHYMEMLVAAYVLITCLLMADVLKKLYKMRCIVKQNLQGEYHGIKLILLSERSVPHTFLNSQSQVSLRLGCVKEGDCGPIVKALSIRFSFRIPRAKIKRVV